MILLLVYSLFPKQFFSLLRTFLVLIALDINVFYIYCLTNWRPFLLLIAGIPLSPIFLTVLSRPPGPFSFYLR
jgi:hypothetical protein